MADSDSRELKARDKQELHPQAEFTRPGPIFTPNVDIYETDQEIMLLADMPGVGPDKLSIDLREDVLTLSAETEATIGSEEAALLTEYQTGTYYRQFSLPEVIDQSKIDAKLRDGVLRLRLPKVEKATPRKIEIKSS